MVNNKVTVLIDGNSVIYRAFFKAPPLMAEGRPTGVIHVFLMVLEKLKKNPAISNIVIVFDAKGKNRRHDMLECYKETRQSMPEDLIYQLNVLKELLSFTGYPIYCVSGYEADDVIYTLSKDIQSPVWIVTKDKDLYQLVDDKVKIYDYQKDEIIDKNKVFEKFGIYPDKIADMLALSGDTSDNIPGIAGIGPKTAVNLLNDFNDLNGILNNTDKLKGKLKEKVENGKDSALLSRKLVELFYIENMPLEKNERDENKLKELYKKYELKYHLSKLEDNTIEDFINMEEDAFLEKGIVEKAEIIVYLDDNIYVCSSKHYDYYNGQNADCYYDVKSIIKKGINIQNNVLDLYIAGWLIDADAGGLKKLKTETEGQFFKRLINKKDDIENKIKTLGLEKLYFDIELPIAFILADMEMEGILVDEDNLRSVASELDNAIQDLLKQISFLSESNLNPNSPKQLGAYLYDTLKLKGSKKNKSGYSTDEESLKDLLISYPEHTDFLNALLKYRELNKLYSTYSLNLLEYRSEKDGRIHTDFKQTGTSTGRLSSANPNMQNIPQRGKWASLIRKSFVAQNGYSFISFDYSQIELRILAHVSEDENLMSAFQYNQDIHSMTAKSIFHLQDSDIVDEEMRRIAKAVNFGILYGLSSFGLSRDTKVSQKEAKLFIEKYFSLYPKVKIFIEKTIESTKKDGYCTTILGRKRFIHDISSRNVNLRTRAERMAVNAPIQGSAADIIKLAMIQCDKYIKESCIMAKSLLQIHDELIFEVHDSILDKFQEDIKHIMENIIKLNVPLVVNYERGKSWSDL